MPTAEATHTPAVAPQPSELNPEMEKVELQAFGLRAMLDCAREELGDDATHEILVSLGVTLERVTAKDAWMSMAFVEAFMDQMVQRGGDPSIIDRFSKASISARYIGLMYPLFRAFGTPLIGYQKIVSMSPRFNKVAFYRMPVARRDFVRLEYWPAEGAPRERGPWFCRSRSVQLSCVPALFGEPRARVAHSRCIERGDDCCVYELTLTRPAEGRQRWVGLAIGLGTAVAFATTLGADPALYGFVCFAAGLAGWASGRGFELSRLVDDRARAIDLHEEALERSIRQNEERYADLLAAKGEVDSKVEVRTHELRETSDQLSRTLQQVQALDRSKTDFFNNVSHELRTPLTLILGPLDDLVAGREPPGGAQSALSIVQRNAARLLSLINQLLDLAKVDAGKMQLALVPTNLREFVSAIARAFELAAARKHVTLAVELADDVQPLAIDTRWIESALTNLIGNALRYVPDGGKIAIRVADLGSDVIFEVVDDGPGISSADAARIFERFAQAQEGQANRGGTGLGLAIVREAARLHGGEASVESAKNKGSTFRLTIPRRVAVSEPSAPSALAIATAAAPPGAIASAQASEKPRVPRSVRPLAGNSRAELALVVEDNADLRQFVADVLSIRYRVVTAENGAEGLQLAREQRPELVVSDLTMPVMDGYELCRRVRADPDLKDIPLIVLTARSDPSAVLAGFEAGASDYILKPFHGRELLARAEVHSRLRRFVRETAAQERRAMLGTLAASVAHQVRNPLTSLASGLPLLKADLTDKMPQRARALLEIMIDSTSRIERLTTDLMDVSRVDREQEVEFSPGDVLAACTRLLTPVASESQIQLHSEIDAAPHLYGRPGDLSHACVNVLDNALRAVGPCGQVEVHGSVVGDRYVIAIGDSGTGVPEQLRKHVFEAFWTNRPAGQGTGLGLAIARQVVEQHGGTISIGSSSLGGALFELHMPLRVTAPGRGEN